jgi:hypothetical protein
MKCVSDQSEVEIIGKTSKGNVVVVLRVDQHSAIPLIILYGGIVVPDLQTELGTWYSYSNHGELDYIWWKDKMPDYPIWPFPEDNEIIRKNSEFFKYLATKVQEYIDSTRNKP